MFCLFSGQNCKRLSSRNRQKIVFELGRAMTESKAVYKLNNWKQYNRALIERGRVNLWFDPEDAGSWIGGKSKGKRGRPHYFTDAAIECMLALRYRYQLPLRATQGFVSSLFELSGLNMGQVEVPTYATLSRRQGLLNPTLELKLNSDEAIHLLVDSTGLKVYGEGEWKVRQHGAGKRREWRKLHLGIDAQSQQIVACVLTESVVHDSEVLPKFLMNIDLEIEKVSADGAYDTWQCRVHIAEKQAQALIPPREGAILDLGEHGQAGQDRDESLRSISRNGKTGWKTSSGYSKRSLVETAMFRFKKSMGAELKGRELENQISEAIIKSKILNRFAQIGMPESYKVQ